MRADGSETSTNYLLLGYVDAELLALYQAGIVPTLELARTQAALTAKGQGEGTAVALYLQQGTGKTALQAGLVGIPSAVLAAICSSWAGTQVVRHGRKVVIGGLLLAVVGLVSSIAVVLLQSGGYVSEWWLLLTLAFVGAAEGSVINPNQTLALADVPLAYAGSSGAVMQTGQRIGTSIGIAVITSVTFATLAVSSWPVAMSVGFGLIIVVVLATLAVAISDQRDRGRDTRAA